jgi:alpha-glucosidase
MLDAEEVHLPPGEWYDYWTSRRFSSTDKILLHPALDEMPLYVRAGAILPMQPVTQSTSEKPAGPLQLRVYAGEDCRGSLYEDDGHTFAYQKGEFLHVSYSCRVSPASIAVTSSTTNSSFHPWWSSASVTIYGVNVEPKEIRIGDHAVQAWHYDAGTHSVALTVPEAGNNWTLQLTL